MQDLRLAVRSLSHAPLVSVVVVVSLALGIGANTAIFSLVNALLLRALPVPHPERLVVVADPSPSEPDQFTYMWSGPMWAQIRQRPELFASAAGYFYSRLNMASGGETEFVGALYVTGKFFETFGIGTMLGRSLTDDDDQRGGGRGGPVAVISYQLWQHRFGGASDVLTQTVDVERVPFRIVGVLPAGFAGPVTGRAADIIIPVGTISLDRGSQFLDHPGAQWLTILARLKPDQTWEAATTTLRAVQPQIRRASLPPQSQHPDAYLKTPLMLLPAAEGNPLAPLRVRATGPILALQTAVLCVLVIACANIANLMLARGTARRTEISVRLALGASRWRLVRQLSAESLVLAAIGAVCGLFVAQWATRVLMQLFSTGSSPLPVDVTPDARVLAFTGVITAVATVLFGMMPAHRATRVDPIESLKEHRLDGATHLRLTNGLVILQVALSLVVVVGGGLLVRSYARLSSKELGFNPDGVLIVDVDAHKAGIPPVNRLVVYGEVRQAVAAIPGVVNAALADLTPVSGAAMAGDVVVSGVPAPAGRGETFANRISPGWLALYGTPVVHGRDFTAADRGGTEKVAIVNQAFVRKFLGDADPIGRVVRQVYGPSAPPSTGSRIVGVASDAVYKSARAGVPPTMYIPFDQIDPALLAVAAPDSTSLSVRAGSWSAMTLTHSVAAAIAGVNRGLDVTFRYLPDVVRGSIALERALAVLSAFFGLLSLLLTVVGIYGVTSYSVNRRRGEIGIRIALGATPGTVVRQMLARVGMLVGIGLVIGAGISLWVTRFAGALLYELKPDDPVTLLGATIVLAAVAALAGWLPASRASRTSPAEVLRGV